MKHEINEINVRSKKIKTRRQRRKKCTFKKISKNSKEENMLKILFFVELKRKKQDCLQFSIRYQETKFFGGYFSHPNDFFYLEYLVS
jgi:hypothetical protein